MHFKMESANLSGNNIISNKQIAKAHIIINGKELDSKK